MTNAKTAEPTTMARSTRRVRNMTVTAMLSAVAVQNLPARPARLKCALSAAEPPVTAGILSDNGFKFIRSKIRPKGI